MKITIFLFYALILLSCNSITKSSNTVADSLENNSVLNINSLSSAQLDTLDLFELSDAKSKEQISQTLGLIDKVDDIFKNDTTRIELYIQINEGDSIIRVPNYDSVPELFYASYNLIRNSNGKIIYLSESPYSESGDWYLEMRHYYFENGAILAFIGHYSTFVSECAEIAYEESAYFYNQDFQLIKKTYSIKDRDEKKLKPKDCNIWRDEYKIEKKLDDYLRTHKFK